jgi:hypothetical protein
MGHKVHYDNDIFFLNETIRVLWRNLKLSLDGNYFSEKVHQDLLFLHSALSKFHLDLTTNKLLLDRPQNLRFLSKTKHFYCELLRGIISGSVAAHLDLSRHFEEYTRNMQQQEHEIMEIRSILREMISSEDPDELVGSEEYKFLFGS